MLGDPNLQFPCLRPYLPPFSPPCARIRSRGSLSDWGPVGTRTGVAVVATAEQSPLVSNYDCGHRGPFGSSNFSGRDCTAAACSLRPDVTNEVEICPKEFVWLRGVSPVCSYGEKSDPEGPKQGGIIEKYRRRTGQRHKSCGWCFVFAR